MIANQQSPSLSRARFLDFAERISPDEIFSSVIMPHDESYIPQPLTGLVLAIFREAVDLPQVHATPPDNRLHWKCRQADSFRADERIRLLLLFLEFHFNILAYH